MTRKIRGIQRAVWRTAFAIAAASMFSGVVGTSAHAATNEPVDRSSRPEHSEPAAHYGTVYSVSYSDELFLKTTDTVTYLSPAEWQALGFPMPTPAPQQFIKLAWSPQVIVVNPWSDDREKWGFELIDEATYVALGAPPVDISGWVPSSTVEVVKYASSDELFATVGLSAAPHKLSPEEWASLGYPKPENLADAFMKLGWNDAVFMLKADGSGDYLNFAEWAEKYGQPTPLSVTQLAGDQWRFGTNGVDIYYENATFEYITHVPPEVYAHAGFPPVSPHLP